jgi:fructokinase
MNQRAVRRPRVTVIGNALVDEIVTSRGRFARLGGAGLNVAMLLGMRGVDASLVAAVAGDEIGMAMRSALSSSGVHLVEEGEAPAVTARAVVHLEGSQPSYEFGGRAYLSFAFSEEAARAVANSDAVVVNAFNYEDRAQARSLRALLGGGHPWRVLDPNVRPGLIQQLDLLTTNLEDLLKVTDILKVSDEDLEVLGGSQGTYPVDRLFGSGAQVIFLTKGAQGGEILTAAGSRFEAPAMVASADIVDTLGAGDASLAGLLVSALAEGTEDAGCVGHRRDLAELDWQVHLGVAMAAAADACRQRGGPAGPAPAPVTSTARPTSV